MKKITHARRIIALAAAFMIGPVITGSAQDNKDEKITGNGKLGTKNVSIQSFDQIKASGIFELKLIQGSGEKVKLEGDENLLEYISVHNEGTSLVIDMDKLKHKNVSFNSKNRLKVYVSFKKLKNLDLNTVGDINSDNELSFDDMAINNKSVGNINLKLSASTINLKNKGVGNITLTGKAPTATIINTGVGSLQAGNFIVQTMDIENTGVGSAEVNVSNSIKVKSGGLGRVRNKGAAAMPHKNKVVDI